MLDPIKYCPYCGTSEIYYLDKDYPYYAHCSHCHTIVSGSKEFTKSEAIYIIQKLKAMDAALKECWESSEAKE